MKAFRWKIAICVVPVVLAAAVVAWAGWLYHHGQGGFKLGVDLAGGTILVYEIDPEQKPAEFKISELVDSLKRRIDPTDIYNITIRAVGENRIEIILPTGTRNQVDAEMASWKQFLAQVEEKWPSKGKPYEQEVARGQDDKLMQLIREGHKDVTVQDIQKFIKENYQTKKGRRELTGEEVERIKELISRQGSLQFRILANETDDKEAIAAAKKYLEDAKTDKNIQAELAAKASQGKPPPPPGGGASFPAAKESNYTYSWVELGPDERISLGLNNAAETELGRGGEWKRAADARAKGDTFSTARLNGAVLYSRPFTRLQVAPKDKEKKVEYFVLTRDPEPGKDVTGQYLVEAKRDLNDKLKPIVHFRFDATGANLFYELTNKNKPEGGFARHLAIVLDGYIMSAPTINEAIRGVGSISGESFTIKDVDTLVAILKAGKLPATLKQKPVSENTIGSTLGEDTVRRGFLAVVLSFAAVMTFMIIYYRFAGLVACSALLANLLLTVACMVLLNATFTLPGLAGLVLMLGMAVDANVLIYERVREERDRGASLALSIRNGYDRAFPTIIDTHLTSIFTAIVLYSVGNDQLKGFGVSLALGLIISLFTSLYMTRVFFDLALAQGWLTKLTMMRLLTRPNINFMGVRNLVFTFSIVTAVLGLGLFLIRGDRGLNIDFVGGTMYTGLLAEPHDIQTIRKLLDEQKERLKVKDVKPLSADTFEIVYDDGDGKEDRRVVYVDKSMIHTDQPPTRDEVLDRADELPDYAIEMIFLQDPNYSSGDKSRVFTVRTSERSRELALTAVSRLLAGKLQEISVTPAIKDDASATKVAKVNLTFTDKNTKETAFASLSRVEALLGQELKKAGLGESANQMVVQGEEGNEQGLYKQLDVTFRQPVDRTALEKALEGLKTEFANTPQPMELQVFDSQLATETRWRALSAILASWGAILLYLWFRFGNWTFGLAAVLCLVHDLFFTLGAIALCHYVAVHVPWLAGILLIQDFKLDLAAVASLLTLVGYSVNDTIVVFDRIREVRGKNPALTPQMINDSVNQTLSRTLLTAFTVWLVVIVLYIWGGAGVHLFAFVMVIGVLVGTFSSIYVASPLLLLFGEGKLPTSVRQRPTEPAGASA